MPNFILNKNLIRFLFFWLFSKILSMQNKMVETILLANILIANKKKGVHNYLIYFSAALVFE